MARNCEESEYVIVCRSGIWGFAFNAGSTRMVTLSKDKTWRLYNVEIEFDRGQDPILVSTGAHPFDPGNSCLKPSAPHERVEEYCTEWCMTIK